MSETQSIVRVSIRGRVQGVGFRAWVEYTALMRGLEGWVRNRRDGSVEAVFAGQPLVVAAMIEECRHGPRGARVDAVDDREVESSALDQRFRGETFSVLKTE
jgi:acylphosphatase